MENIFKQYENLRYNRLKPSDDPGVETVHTSSGLRNNSENNRQQLEKSQEEDRERIYEIIDNIESFLRDNQTAIDKIMNEEGFAEKLATTCRQYGDSLRNKITSSNSSFEDIMGNCQQNLSFVKRYEKTNEKGREVTVRNLNLIKDYFNLLNRSEEFEKGELHLAEGYGGAAAKNLRSQKLEYLAWCKEKVNKKNLEQNRPQFN